MKHLFSGDLCLRSMQQRMVASLIGCGSNCVSCVPVTSFCVFDSTGCSLGLPAEVCRAEHLEDRSEGRKLKQRGRGWRGGGGPGRRYKRQRRGGKGRILILLSSRPPEYIKKKKKDTLKLSCLLSAGGSGAVPRRAGELSAAALQVHGRQRWIQRACTIHVDNNLFLGARCSFILNVPVVTPVFLLKGQGTAQIQLNKLKRNTILVF